MDTEDKARDCHICGTHCEPGAFCPTCTASFEHRRQPEEMTGEERMAEMRQWGGALEISFDLLHKRIEELVGRSVWTHEMGLDWQGLILEAGGRREAPTMEAICDLVPPEKRIIVTQCD